MGRQRIDIKFWWRKRQFRRPRQKWENNIEIDIAERGEDFRLKEVASCFVLPLGSAMTMPILNW
jgi:hypothetical protein